MSSQVRPRARSCRGRGRRRAAPRAPRLRRRVGVVAQLAAVGRPSSSARSANSAGESADRLRREPRPGAAPRLGDAAPSTARRRRREESADRDPRRSAAFRCATARAVLGGQRAASREAGAPAARSKYARRAAGPPLTTTSRSGVNTSVETSERSCSAARRARAVQRRALRLARRRRDLDLQPRAGAIAGQLDSARLRAEADELGIVPASRREALRPDVDRLEQVRLARAVPADGQHEPGGQLQLERRVRAEVAERDSRTISRPGGSA